MAKKENQEAEVAETTAVATQAAVEKLPAKFKADDGSILDSNDMLSQLESSEAGQELVNEYWVPVEGEEVRAFFLGLTSMPKMNSTTGERVDAVKLLIKDEDGAASQVINADKVLVSSLKDMKALTPVTIVNTGWTKGKNGKYRQFSINTLILKN